MVHAFDPWYRLSKDDGRITVTTAAHVTRRAEWCSTDPVELMMTGCVATPYAIYATREHFTDDEWYYGTRGFDERA